jgi:hypothetical protein
LTRPTDARSAPDARRAPHGSTILVALGITAAFPLGCANTRMGDPPAPPVMNVCGDGVHISSTLTTDINGVETPGFYGPAPWFQPSNQMSGDCPYPPSVNVYSTCLTVTAVDTYDETGNGAIGTVYVQDNVPAPAPQYAGTSLFDPSFSPPDLRVQPGNVLDITGVYEEFIGPSSFIFPECETLPQIAGSAVFRFDGEVPAPVVLNPGDLDSYVGARAYESMLVTVKNVTLTGSLTTSGTRASATVAVPTGGTIWNISNELFDVGGQFPLTQGQTFASVTGIVTYFGSFNVAPRSVADFHLVGGGTPDGGGG